MSKLTNSCLVSLDAPCPLVATTTFHGETNATDAGLLVPMVRVADMMTTETDAVLLEIVVVAWEVLRAWTDEGAARQAWDPVVLVALQWVIDLPEVVIEAVTEAVVVVAVLVDRCVGMFFICYFSHMMLIVFFFTEITVIDDPVHIKSITKRDFLGKRVYSDQITHTHSFSTRSFGIFSLPATIRHFLNYHLLAFMVSFSIREFT